MMPGLRQNRKQCLYRLRLPEIRSFREKTVPDKKRIQSAKRFVPKLPFLKTFTVKGKNPFQGKTGARLSLSPENCLPESVRPFFLPSVLFLPQGIYTGVSVLQASLSECCFFHLPPLSGDFFSAEKERVCPVIYPRQTFSV